jgi:hypothetical protein
VASAGKNSLKRKIGNWKVAPSAKRSRITTRENFLVTFSQFDKTARHEMCSSHHIRFYCVRFAGILAVLRPLFPAKAGAPLTAQRPLQETIRFNILRSNSLVQPRTAGSSTLIEARDLGSENVLAPANVHGR